MTYPNSVAVNVMAGIAIGAILGTIATFFQSQSE